MEVCQSEFRRHLLHHKHHQRCLHDTTSGHFCYNFEKGRQTNRQTCDDSKYLLLRLKNQLAKIHNCSLDTSHSAQNLGFIFDEHLTFSDQITSLSKAYYKHIHQLRCIQHSSLTSIRQLHVPLLPLSSTPNLINVILSTINSLSRLPISD